MVPDLGWSIYCKGGLKIEPLKIYLGNWQFNAGLVGFINIINHYDKKSIIIKNDYIEFTEECLENFSEKYFNYLSDTYVSYTSWYKITSYEDFINNYEDNDYSNFDEKSLEYLNYYIRDILKKYLKSNSYKAAYELISSNLDIMEIEKKLSPVKIKKEENIENVLPDVKKQIRLIKEATEFLNRDDAKKYILGKNVMYQFIKNSWSGVSFLNSQTKEKNFYQDYNQHFVNPVLEYLGADKQKYKFECFICDSKMKDMSNTLGFLNHTGFDTSRKASHAWNFSNDIAICDVCKLIYSCMPAGITYAYDKGIFVNDNSSIKNLIKINSNLKTRILSYDASEKSTNTYRALVNSFEQQYDEKLKYELADIQVVRYERISPDKDRYMFNILSKTIIKVIINSKKYLDSLTKTSYRENGNNVNIYEETINRLFSNQNMYTLIHRCIVYKTGNPRENYFNGTHIINLIRINIEYLKGVGYLDKYGLDIANEGNRQGYFLKSAYIEKNSVDKVDGICYRLMNALKTSNIHSFMDTLINCYLYVKKPVPKIFIDTFKDEDVFKNVGYAFVSGLTVEVKEKDNKEGK